MRKVVAAEYVTADGVMTDPGGAEVDWTFEGFAAAWPSLEEAEGRVRGSNEHASELRRLEEPEGTADVERDAAEGQCRRRGCEPEGPAGPGPPHLPQRRARRRSPPARIDREITAHGLSGDAGIGKRLFRDGGERRDQKLSDVTMTDSGVALLTYEPAGS
jgi:hypothetical protein